MIKSMWVRLRLWFRQIVNYFERMVHDIIDKTYVKYNQSLLFIIIHRFYCIITANTPTETYTNTIYCTYSKYII